MNEEPGVFEDGRPVDSRETAQRYAIERKGMCRYSKKDKAWLRREDEKLLNREGGDIRNDRECEIRPVRKLKLS